VFIGRVDVNANDELRGVSFRRNFDVGLSILGSMASSGETGEIGVRNKGN
jgi:hypothetical protein